MAKSVEKVFHILELLSEQEYPLSLGKIADCVNANRSTTRRFLLDLIKLGYVAQDEDSRQYRITSKVASLGRLVHHRNSLLDLAKPYVDKLADTTGETINLAILDGTDVFYVDVRNSHHSLRLHVEVGGKAPFHSTALGKALVAFIPEKEFKERFKYGLPLQRSTVKTITTWAELEQELQKVRDEGVAYDDEELWEGLYCIGAPVMVENRAIAAISISTPINRMTPVRKDLFIRLVFEQARLLGEELTLLNPNIMFQL